MAKPANTAAMTPFLFDRTFDRFGDSANSEKSQQDTSNATDSATPEPEAVAEPPPVTFTEEEMNRASEERYMAGHADGFREGHAEAMDTLEGRLNELLEQLAPMVANLGTIQQQANDRAQSNMARIVQALTAKLMPVYMKTYGAEEAMAVISECLTEMQDPGRLMIHLSEETAELLGDRLNKAAQSSGFEGQIRLQTDPDLGPSDVRIDWGAGGAQRRYDSIRQEVDDYINRAVARIEEELEANLPESPHDAPQAPSQDDADATAPDMDAASTEPPPTEATPAEATPVETAPVETVLAETASVETGADAGAPMDAHPDDANPDNANPDDTNPDDTKTESAMPPGMDADPIEEPENGR